MNDIYFVFKPFYQFLYLHYTINVKFNR